MRMNGVTKADLHGIRLKHHSNSNTTTVKPEIHLGVDAEGAQQLFGAEFKNLIFDQVDAEGDFRFKKIIPAGTWEFHDVELVESGISFSCQPKFLGVEPTKEADRVVVKLELPFALKGTDAIADLASNLGQLVELKFEKAQGELAFTEGQGAFGNPEPQVSTVQ